MATDRRGKIIELVAEIYVAVFPVSVSEDRQTEVILAGYKKDPNAPGMSRVRATVETQAKAVGDLVQLCDEIIDEQNEIESYRLLKFDTDGIHVLSPDDFRTFDRQYSKLQWGFC